MFGVFKKQTTAGKKVILKLSGLHCTSCSLNIDGELEETPGVLTANTSYAHSQSVVHYDPDKVTPEKLVEVITKLGYEVSPV